MSHCVLDTNLSLSSPPVVPPPGSNLTLAPLRRSGPLCLSSWFITRVERPGTVSLGSFQCQLKVLVDRLLTVCPSHMKLWAGEAVSVHHVRTEELPPCSLPQLEARSDSGTVYVRHPAENLWDVHRAGGLLPIGSGFYCSKMQLQKSKIRNWGPLWFYIFFFLVVPLWSTEKRSVDRLLVPWSGPSGLQQLIPAEVWPSSGCSVLQLHHGAAPLLSDRLHPTGRELYYEERSFIMEWCALMFFLNLFT